MTFFSVTFVFILIYLLVGLLIFFVLKKIFSEEKKLQKILPISVIVSAKNESENIFELTSSLRKINYPQNFFEAIIIDDHSTDETYEKALKLTENFDNFFVFKNQNDKALAKKGALSFGISKSKFPFLLITDADCMPQANWLKSFAESFSEGNDFVFGAAPFIVEKNFVTKISAFENLRSSILSFSFASLTLPYSASARSFGFSKKAFEKLNGYKNTYQTLSGDDDLLLREAVKNKMKIGFALNQNAFVYSSSKKNFREYFIQKARHTKTSFFYLAPQKIAIGFWHLINLLFLFSPVLIFFNIYLGIPFLIKIFFDLFLVLSFQKKFGYSFSFLEIFFFQITYEILIIINFFNALFIRDKWK